VLNEREVGSVINNVIDTNEQRKNTESEGEHSL
jgi:hypothetical protein